MKQWNGLLRKEWAAMSGQFYASVVASILFVGLIPFGSRLFNWGLDVLELSLISSLTWMIICIFIPTIILLISLGKEMNRPDIWLHSGASIFKMFGSKAVYAALVGVVNLVIPFIAIIIGSRFSAFPLELTFKMALQVGSLFFISFYITSLLIMGTGLFFGVLYQLTKPVMRGFALPNVVILFLISSWLVEWITTKSFYKELTSFGAITNPGEEIFTIVKGNFFFEIDTVVFYTGDILVDLVVGVLLFITAVVLFEKKVRI